MRNNISGPIFSAVCIVAILLSVPSMALAGMGGWLQSHQAQLSLGGGWGSYAMKKPTGTTYYNYSAQRQSSFLGSGHNRISDGPGYYIEAGFSPIKKLSLSLGTLYLSGQERYLFDFSFMDDYWYRSPIYDTVTASMFAPIIRVKYPVLKTPVTIHLSIGSAWIFGKVSVPAIYEVTDIPTPHLKNMKFTANGPGAIAAVDLSFKLIRFIRLNSELGYRYLNAGQLHDRYGNKWNLDLDFSGIYATAGIVVGY